MGTGVSLLLSKAYIAGPDRIRTCDQGIMSPEIS